MRPLRLTDGGMETSLVHHQGFDLPHFASFPLIDSDEGRRALVEYFDPYLDISREHGVGFVVGTPTWRANGEWGQRLGYDRDALAAVNARSVEFAREVAESLDETMVEGVVGPRGDGYVVGVEMTPDEAADYHHAQITALAEAGVDQTAALTLTYPAEAIGIVRAADVVGVPAIISFTVETDGRLPNGETLHDAVAVVDAETNAGAMGFMINCAHPTHFANALVEGDWLQRIVGIRANASTSSHAELDAAEDLDEGDPADLAQRYAVLQKQLPALAVLGGCCGTDFRHVRAIAEACIGR